MPSALKVMVYSSNADTRAQIMLALGRRPSRELPEVQYVEVATEPVVIRTADAGGLDLLILDGDVLDVNTRLHAVMIEGKMVHENPWGDAQ